MHISSNSVFSPFLAFAFSYQTFTRTAAGQWSVFPFPTVQVTSIPFSQPAFGASSLGKPSA